MAGNCAIYRSWNSGETLTASDLTTSFTTVGVTNMTPQCLDDYSANETQMQTTTDPYPSSAASLATSTAGELERIRYILKQITGWSQWYAHTEGTYPRPSYWFSPISASFPNSNFPALTKNSGTNWIDYTLDYDATTSEIAYWWTQLPTGVDISAATIEIYSRQAAATSGTIGWIVTSLTRADGEAWDTAGNADTVTADDVEGTAGQIHRQSKALTITGWGAGEILLLRIARDPANDTLAEDAKFMGAMLRLA